MKILFYDKFFESLINLPKGTQKKVIEFQKKFRSNSKSSGIHLESISTFKDHSLRSARVDQTYRAIIKVPESGDIYYLLWVDHHNKAYEWASNKVFQWNDETQSMQVFTAPESVIEIKQKNKIEVNESEPFFSKFKTEELLKVGVPEILLPSIANIHNIEDLEEVEKFIPTDVFENLFYLLDGADIDTLIFEIEEGKVKAKEIDAKVGSINNQRNFIELTDDILFNEILSGSLNKWKYYLHPSQRKLVGGNFKGSVKVSGGAGTGKTVAALHRLKHLSQIKDSSERILFTTYTKTLTDNLNHLISGLGIDASKITVTNIDKLVRSLVLEYNILNENYKVFEFDSVKNASEIWEELLSSELTPYSPEFLESEYKDVILCHDVKSLDEFLKTSRKGRGKPISRRQRKEIWSFIEEFQAIKKNLNFYYKDEVFNALYSYLTEQSITPFDYCLVDELQDFSNVELRLVRCIVKEKPNDLFMVGDPMQKIYERHINFSKVGINVRGKRSRRLRINYRTTEEIKKLAFSVIKDCHYDNFDGEEENKAGYVSLFHGNKPNYKIFKTKNNEIDFVFECLDELNAKGYQYSDIALCARTKDALKDFRNVLHKKNLPYTDNSINTNKEANSISLLTFHRIKGLEFKHVFIIDANDRTIPKLSYTFNEMDLSWQESYLKNEKSLLYVAISRAIENVTITGIGKKSESIKID
ncbi:3'-5' exonuclease [Candidatus Venteria ishoeyi]|uniref:DNA 3'-5' helicase n=1 Tax=Candidatus Venteria ishoeyi TaxID=1899563 RepID=A0A1H6F7K8_9GAMM|nr:3'-5' exonuclease [Candidatus Venteria ishoeyi]SEH05044.1 ATP-dependent DNA helicase PcrA [Candidatus Venteria ishoeyi]